MNIKFLNEYAKVPTRGSSYAAGYDLYAAIGEPVTVFPGTTVPVTTGLAMEIPEDFFGAIFARSGLATKRGLRPANCVGVVDADIFFYLLNYLIPKKVVSVVKALLKRQIHLKSEVVLSVKGVPTI